MKIVRNPTPLAFLVLSALACTPSSNRGPTAGTSNDAANDLAHSGGEEAERANSSDEPRSTEPPRGAPSQALGAPPTRAAAVPRPTGPYHVRIVGPAAVDLTTFYHDGRSYVLGAVGERYAVVVSNPTARRVEAVISIDGLDAIDGKPADYVHQRGYVLPAYGSATIEGFRTSLDQVATFRFSSVTDSYAGRMGQARDVGVIGVAFFPERPPTIVAPPPPPVAMSRSDDWRGSGHSDSSRAPTRTSHPSETRQAEAAPAQSPAAASPSLGDPVTSVSNGVASGRGGAAAERKGLGTEFGEARESHVDEVMFVRANATSPSDVVSFRYNDRTGLLALGIRVDRPAVSDAELRTRETADPFRANRFAAPPP